MGPFIIWQSPIRWKKRVCWWRGRWKSAACGSRAVSRKLPALSNLARIPPIITRLFPRTGLKPLPLTLMPKDSANEAMTLLHDGKVTSVLTGASKPQQILDNIGALKNTHFSDEELKLIDEISAR